MGPILEFAGPALRPSFVKPVRKTHPNLRRTNYSKDPVEVPEITMLEKLGVPVKRAKQPPLNSFTCSGNWSKTFEEGILPEPLELDLSAGHSFYFSGEPVLLTLKVLNKAFPEQPEISVPATLPLLAPNRQIKLAQMEGWKVDHAVDEAINTRNDEKKRTLACGESASFTINMLKDYGMDLQDPGPGTLEIAVRWFPPIAPGWSEVWLKTPVLKLNVFGVSWPDFRTATSIPTAGGTDKTLSVGSCFGPEGLSFTLLTWGASGQDPSRILRLPATAADAEWKLAWDAKSRQAWLVSSSHTTGGWVMVTEPNLEGWMLKREIPRGVVYDLVQAGDGPVTVVPPLPGE